MEDLKVGLRQTSKMTKRRVLETIDIPLFARVDTYN